MARASRTLPAVRLGRLEVETRWTWCALLATYLVTGVLTAVSGGHLTMAGRDGVLAHAVGFAALAVAAALFHELGHALAGLAFGRRPVRLVLKAGAAVQIEAADPGSRGATAPAESLVALGGPLASALIALAYVNVGSELTSPFAWAALLALIDGLVNLVPLGRHSDGDRVVDAWVHTVPHPAQAATVTDHAAP